MQSQILRHPKCTPRDPTNALRSNQHAPNHLAAEQQWNNAILCVPRGHWNRFIAFPLDRRFTIYFPGDNAAIIRLAKLVRHREKCRRAYFFNSRLKVTDEKPERISILRFETRALQKVRSLERWKSVKR